MKFTVCSVEHYDSDELTIGQIKEIIAKCLRGNRHNGFYTNHYIVDVFNHEDGKYVIRKKREYFDGKNYNKDFDSYMLLTSDENLVTSILLRDLIDVE